MYKSSASYKVLMNWSALISSSRSSSSFCAPMGSCGADTMTSGIVPVIKRICLFGHRHICRDPGFAYVIPVTSQSYGEPRAIPTCLSRQGQVQDTLAKLEREGHPIQARMIN